ncbi:MAG: response regulator transcription factor [Pseudomonadales bacterium]|nr:response regulator transcription factor [Pseudomonadales bacterium]MCP5215143.1 response regulator transcription factor [Pseudomonadales bacterium]
MDDTQTVFVVDDDEGVREGLSMLLESVGLACETYASSLGFLDKFDPLRRGCLVLDIRMPRMTGLELQEKLNQLKSAIPIIFITGHGDVQMAVEAMRRGALDFIRKPFREQELLESINEALTVEAGKHKRLFERKAMLDKIAALSDREREVFERVADGEMNKVIAIDLGISERTVEVHRSQVMKKLGVRTLAQLVRLNIDASMPLRESVSGGSPK